ncbi:hypothetical protein Golax_002081 [Gossypium laxum]|uniref:Uncharacterized protein n=1 Tax=Gossypium laxum TaxID=34288 RepID=A0A7J9AS09_9ROSI|nr:hypothetical protein [Gossypium laxum]
MVIHQTCNLSNSAEEVSLAGTFGFVGLTIVGLEVLSAIDEAWSFTLLVFTLEGRTLSPNHFPHAGQGGHGLRLDEVFKVLDLLGIKDSSGPSHGGEGH